MTGLKRGTVKLIDHRREWTKEANNAILKLRQVFGDAAVDIRHIGSTSIMTIKAKPIIDIAVAVEDFDKVPEFFSKLNKAGFIHKAVNDNDSQYFFVCEGNALDTVSHHIHIVRAESEEWRNYNLFRDFLNARPDVAKIYEENKLWLANKYEYDRESYTSGKSDLIRLILRKALVWSYLGKTVTVKMDRPMGTFHQKHGKELMYPINYGYIEGVYGGDGEELDVYILGTDRPLDSCECCIIGIIHRENDVEDKLVAAPKGMKFNQAEIKSAVNFAEKYYVTFLEHLYHKSCGMIIFRKNGEHTEFLLVHENNASSWSFPKGHCEPYETEMETAMREVFEETNLKPVMITGFRETVTYKMSRLFEKTVVFFLGRSDENVKLQEDELSEYRWVCAEDAKVLLRHKLYIELIEKAEKAIDEKARTADV